MSLRVSKSHRFKTTKPSVCIIHVLCFLIQLSSLVVSDSPPNQSVLRLSKNFSEGKEIFDTSTNILASFEIGSFDLTNFNQHCLVPV